MKTNTNTAMVASDRVIASKGRAPRYTVKYYDSADPAVREAQAKIAAKLAQIDAHPHKDPVYRPERTTPTASQVSAATARASIYRVQMSDDEIAEIELQETRERDRATALIASVETAETEIAPVAPVVETAPVAKVAKVRAPKVETKDREIARLEREYNAQLRRESRAVENLPDNATQKQTDRVWAIAAESDRALRRLRVARGEEQPRVLVGAAAQSAAGTRKPVRRRKDACVTVAITVSAPVAPVETAPTVVIAETVVEVAPVVATVAPVVVDHVRAHNDSVTAGHWEVLATTSTGRGLGMCGHSHATSGDAETRCDWSPGVAHVRAPHYVKTAPRARVVATATAAPTSAPVSRARRAEDPVKKKARRDRFNARQKTKRDALAVAS